MGLKAEVKAAATAWPSWVLHAPSRDRARAAAKVRGMGASIKAEQVVGGGRHRGEMSIREAGMGDKG